MVLQSLSLRSKVATRIGTNLITLKDIRVNKRFWSKPILDPLRYSKGGKEYYVDIWGDEIENPTEEQKKGFVNYSYVPLRFFPRWYYWQETYNFLPVPDYYEDIVDRALGVLGLNDKKDKKKAREWKFKKDDGGPEVPVWDALEDEEYYILASGENIMTIILQNRKQYDWIRSDCVVFFGLNSRSPKGRGFEESKRQYETEKYKRNNEGKEPDEKIKIREGIPLLYWVKSWRYINPANLYAEIVLEKCYVWHYFGNWMNTWYTAKINQSQLNNDHVSYTGAPIKPGYEPGQLVRYKTHTKHWPMDEDWYVVRKATPQEINPPSGVEIWPLEKEEKIAPPILITHELSRLLKQEYNIDKNPGVKINECFVDLGGSLGFRALNSDEVIDESIAPFHHCPACDACFDFCGDLRIKKAMSPVYGPEVGEVIDINGKISWESRYYTSTYNPRIEGGWKEIPANSAWQPGRGRKDYRANYRLVYSLLPGSAKDMLLPSGETSTVCIKDEKGGIIISVPTNVKLKFFVPGSKIWTSDIYPTLIYLVDADHDELKSETGWDLLAPHEMSERANVSSNGKRFPRNVRKFCWNYLPQVFTEEPHLLVHSTVQFYFLYKLLFTANCKHLWIKRKGGGFALGYRVLTRSSIAGILYMFESLDIFYKWELRVRGTIRNSSFANRVMALITSGIASTVNKAMEDVVQEEIAKGTKKGAKLAGKAIGKGVAWASNYIPVAGPMVSKWIGSFFGDGDSSSDSSEAIEKQTEEIKKQVETSKHDLAGKSAGKIPNSKTFSDQQGAGNFGSKGQNEEKPENEEHGKRKATATNKTKDKEVKPSIFYSGTIDFSYDFWEFSNRSTANPFMIRFEYSEILYNNLVNNNNASPIQNFEIRGNRFCQMVKTGDFQADVRLGFDIKGRNLFQNLCAKGLTWYDEGTKWDENGNIISDWFTPWVPKYRALQSYTVGAVFNTHAGQAMEDRETKEIKERKRVKKSALKTERPKCEAGFDTYFRVSHPAIFDAIKKWKDGLKVSQHEYNQYFTGTTYNPYLDNNGLGVKGGAFCWGCFFHGVDGSGSDGIIRAMRSKGVKSLTVNIPSLGYDPGEVWIAGIWDKDKKSSGPEIRLENIPQDGSDFDLIFYDDGKIEVSFWDETTYYHSEGGYKAETYTMMQAQNFASRENKEPEWTDRTTASASGIGAFEPDKMPEIKETDSRERKNKLQDPERERTEKGGGSEKDYQEELEKTKEKRESERKERDAEKELQKEKEKEAREKEQLEKEQKKLAEKQDRERKEKQLNEKKQQDAERIKQEREQKARKQKDRVRKEREQKEKEKK